MDEITSNPIVVDPIAQAKAAKLSRIKELQAQRVSGDNAVKSPFPYWVGVIVFALVAIPLSILGVWWATKGKDSSYSPGSSPGLYQDDQPTPSKAIPSESSVIKHGLIKELPGDSSVKADYMLIDDQGNLVSYLRESSKMKDMFGFLGWEADVKGVVVSKAGEPLIIEVEGLVF